MQEMEFRNFLFFVLFTLLTGLPTWGQVAVADNHFDYTFKVRKAGKVNVAEAYTPFLFNVNVTDISAYQENSVDSIPNFPGGEDCMNEFIQQETKKANCPGGCREGTVNVICLIDTTGEVVSARTSKSLHPLLDGEAIRLVRAFPTFSPGYFRGAKVPVYRTIQVPFKND